jgi:glucose-6-phosphate isomerase, archaeal
VSVSHPEQPFVTQINPETGFGAGFAAHYIKTFEAMHGVYQEDGVELTSRGPELSYEVFSTQQTDLPGALTVGTSIVKPGRIGEEFALTRGHLHRIADRAEMYFGLNGRGVMLLESVEGEVHALEIVPGSMVYVPGGWLHRSVNVGAEVLVTLFCFSADSGQNYEIVEQSGGMKKLVVDDGQGGWMLKDNPRYVPRTS